VPPALIPFTPQYQLAQQRALSNIPVAGGAGAAERYLAARAAADEAGGSVADGEAGGRDSAQDAG
jgi:hypothetical protein